jgi:hypothetical protein
MIGSFQTSDLVHGLNLILSKEGQEMNKGFSLFSTRKHFILRVAFHGGRHSMRGLLLTVQTPSSLVDSQNGVF